MGQQPTPPISLLSFTGAEEQLLPYTHSSFTLELATLDECRNLLQTRLCKGSEKLCDMKLSSHSQTWATTTPPGIAARLLVDSDTQLLQGSQIPSLHSGRKSDDLHTDPARRDVIPSSEKENGANGIKITTQELSPCERRSCTPRPEH